MAVPSNVQITYAGQDITSNVLYSSARFDAQASAGVGTFQFDVKDTARTLNFITGKEVTLLLDGKKYFSGPLMQVGRKFAFPAVDTTNLNTVTTRQFTLSGTNWNSLFDRRVTRNPQDYYHYLPARPASTTAGALLREFCEKYLDLTGINSTTYVDDIGTSHPGEEFLWKAQGTTWREQMEWLSLFNGAIYYIDADKRLHYHSPDDLWAAWGFSDRPNNASVTSTATKFTGALYGFRELNTDQDISQIVNDAFIWGGSEWAGEGSIVFARAQNTESISENGRWQYAEPLNPDLGIQEKVTERAKAIVGGPSYPFIGTDPQTGLIRSQGVPAWTLSLSWFGHDVPTNTNNLSKHHLTPGDIVTIVLWVHGSGPTKPLILTLPLRSISISFPTLPSGTTGKKTFVRFDGQFGLSVNDPHSLWQAILRRRKLVQTRVTSSVVTEAQVPGATWSGAPLESPDGTRKTFTLMAGSQPVRYLAGTSEVYLNGLRMRQGSDYSEAPTQGTITFFTAPRTGSSIWVYVRMAA
jgi:hypothetical protein